MANVVGAISNHSIYSSSSIVYFIPCSTFSAISSKLASTSFDISFSGTALPPMAWAMVSALRGSNCGWTKIDFGLGRFGLMDELLELLERRLLSARLNRFLLQAVAIGEISEGGMKNVKRPAGERLHALGDFFVERVQFRIEFLQVRSIIGGMRGIGLFQSGRDIRRLNFQIRRRKPNVRIVIGLVVPVVFCLRRDRVRRSGTANRFLMFAAVSTTVDIFSNCRGFSRSAVPRTAFPP